MSEEDFSNAAGANGTSHMPGKHRGPRFSWTPAYEATFFRSLCESVHLGLREGSTFKQEAWERAISCLIKHHNAFAHKNHLINKSDNARKKFRLWRGLREDPEFRYDRTTRTVTASEDAWRRHIEKEPLSRSLKGRPFEHEDFYEVLFPDVIGSGGAPKRLTTKTRRKEADDTNGLGEQSAPGTAMMDILGEPAYTNPSQTRIPQASIPPALSSAATTIPSGTVQPATQQHGRPVSNAMPTRTSIGSSSALTPPEDSSQHQRKRFQPQDNNIGNGQAAHPEKRRRTVAPQPAAPPAPMQTGYMDLAQVPANPVSVPSNGAASAPVPAAAGTLLPDGITLLAEALRSVKARAMWSEQAMDLFFRDFADEDMDLQLKIAEKVLSDENKAMVFCKMPDQLRKHWVRRLREMHNQRMT